MLFLALALALFDDPHPKSAAPLAPRTIALVLRAPAPEAPGTADVVLNHAEHTGVLRAWATSETLDLEIELRTPGGRSLAHDDSEGGGTTPFANLFQHAGDEIEIVVTSHKGGGPARLCVYELVEDDETQAAQRHARAVAEQCGVDCQAGKLPAARASATALLNELLLDPRFDLSDDLQDGANMMVRVLDACGEQATALPTLRRLTALHDTTFPHGNLRRLLEFAMLGSGLIARGEPANGLAVLADTLRGLETRGPSAADAVDAVRGEIAGALYNLGRLEEARAAFEQVVARFASHKPPEDAGLLVARTNLAICHSMTGELDQARSEIEDILAIQMRVRGERNPDVVRDQQLFANVLLQQGDVARAAVVLEHALAIAREIYPAGHSEIGMMLGNAGIIAYRHGDYAAAQARLEECVPILEAVYGADSPITQQVRINLAGVLVTTKAVEPALKILEPLCADLEARLSGAHPLVRSARLNLATVELDRGDASAAHTLLAAALAALEGTFPPEHSELLRTRLWLLVSAAALGRTDEARELTARNTRALREAFERSALRMSAREAEQVVASFEITLSQTLSFAGEIDPEKRAEMDRLAFATIESARSIGLVAQRATSIAARGSTNVSELQRRVREETAAVTRAAQSGDVHALGDAVAAQEAGELVLREKILASAHGAALFASHDADAIAARLGSHAAAIGWWVYTRTNLNALPKIESTPSLMAFVLRADGTLARVELGPLAEVESAVTKWREAILATDSAAEAQTGEHLRALVFDPLRKHLAGCDEIQIALDGPLHVVPLDALPDGTGRLGEHMAVDVRATLSEIATATQKSANDPELLALGGVDFGTAPPGSKGLEPLPWTEREIDGAAHAFERGFGSQAKVVRLAGRAATRATLCAALQHARFAHIATHGRFEADLQPADARVRGADTAMLVADVNCAALAPLVLCTLALADANADPDGRVSAEELGALDLSGLDLAVLSACDTGAGVPELGQGVASFQKALSAAGARSLIVSLWPVSDAATSELMNAFYRGLWIDKLGKSAALRRAKHKLAERAAPVRDWAGWILSGEPD